MKRVAVVALVLLTACAGSPNQRPKVRATTSTSSSTTSTSVTTVAGTTTTITGALAKPCAATDLAVAGIGNDGASGHTLNYISLKNVSTFMCSLSGFPTSVSGHSRDGVTLTDVHNGAYQPDPKPGNVAPGGSGAVILDSYNRCTDEYPDKPVRTYSDIHLGLPGGGELALGDFAVGPTCIVSVSQLGVAS